MNFLAVLRMLVQGRDGSALAEGSFMSESLPYLDHIPEQHITVVTVVADGVVILAIHGRSLPAAAAEPHLPGHLRMIRQPLGSTDPRAQHEQVVADVRAGLYGDSTTPA